MAGVPGGRHPPPGRQPRHLRRGRQADVCAGDALRRARFRLVEQFRYPIGARRWEFPQGTAPDLADAEPSELAERELREETGLRATSFEALGQLDVAPGMTSQRGWVFLATGIAEGEADREHEEQDMRSAWFPREDVEQMIRSGVIADAQSIAAYGLFLLRTGDEFWGRGWSIPI